MNTHVLQTTQQTARLGELIESFISGIRYIPRDARPIMAADELPYPLRQLARLHLDNEAWRAWTNGGQVWLVIGKLSRAFSETLNHTALQVCFYDRKGNMATSGVWALRPSGRWELCVASGSPARPMVAR